MGRFLEMSWILGSEMADNVLTTKTINEINIPENRFFIPDYQRGYRWGKREIEAFLEDILGHSRKKSDRNYCLQPIVVAKRPDESWEVIDGQQRLTTIFLVLRYTNKEETHFRVSYETRQDSERFLMALPNRALEDERDIDSAHILAAWSVIAEWFRARSHGAAALKSKVFLHLSESVEVIWYETNENVPHMDIFTRLNIGKIPLTDSELTKALLLNALGRCPDGAAGSEVRTTPEIFADQWNQIESGLHDDRFWLFLNHKDTGESNRIDYLFRFLYQLESEDKSAPREMDVFYWMENQLNPKEGDARCAEAIWNDVRAYYTRLEEWFSARDLYHLSGYLVTIGTRSFVDLFRDAKDRRKSYVIKYLRGLIADDLREELNGRDFRDLSYEDQNDPKLIRKILLLFSVIIVQQSEDPEQRFSFFQYKSQRQTLEHIHAQHSDLLKQESERRIWLADHLEALRNVVATEQTGARAHTDFQQLIERIENALAQPTVGDLFESLQPTVIEALSSATDDDSAYGGFNVHGIDNLALLDAETNSMLKNAVFAVKRTRILEHDRNGRFLLPATRNAFLKYYSPTVHHTLYWTAEDRQNYTKAIQETIDSFLGHAVLGEVAL